MKSITIKKWQLFLLCLFLLNFSVVFAASAPKLNTPILNGSNITFSWSAPGASNNRIVISQNSSFSGYNATNNTCSSSCFTTVTGTSTSHTKNNATPGNTYYWKVRSNFSSENVALWSNVGSFTVPKSTPIPPPVPVCTSPQILNPAKTACINPPVPVCTSPQILNAAKTACINPPVPVCRSPQILNAAKTACINPPVPVCTSPQILNPAKTACINPPVPVCTSPQILNAAKTACINPPVPVCTSPQVLNAAKTACINPTVPVCTSPQILNPAKTACINPPVPVCRSPQVLNAAKTACINPPVPVCTSPQVLNAAKTACVNPPVPVCTSPQVLNAAKTACVTPPPLAPTLNTPANNPPPLPNSKVQYTWKFDQKNVTSQRIVISQNQGFTGFRDANGISNCDTSCVTRATSDNSDRITVAGNTASFTQNVTSPGQKYWWKVRVNGAGGATWSKTRSFTIKGQDNLDFSNTSVNWNSNAYRNDNIFWKSGFAPKRFSPPSPQLGNAKGNCTWYAHGRARQLGFSSNLNSMSSNAKTWANAAKNSGILVDQVPSVGAIAQTTKGGGGFGHVAFIEKVNSNGTLLISESSYAPGTSWDFEYRTRTVNKSDFENYIHVKKP